MSSARCYLLLKLSPPPPPPLPHTFKPFPRAPIVAACLFWEVHLFINSHTTCLYHCEGKKRPFLHSLRNLCIERRFCIGERKKKNIARNASVGVFVLQRIFVQRRGLFIVIESNWLRRRATNEISFAELFRAGSQFVTNYVPCDARERELSCQITGSFAAWVLFLFADTLLECSAVRNFSAGDAVLRSRSHFGVIFVFVGTRSVFALH